MIFLLFLLPHFHIVIVIIISITCETPLRGKITAVQLPAAPSFTYSAATVGWMEELLEK